MRTRFLFILTLCLVLCLVAVSCNADSTLRAEETLVSVSFDNGSARSLSASLESFDTENYYWCYKATKVDGSNFTSGQTSGFVSVQEGKGLSANNQKVQISGFSQGTWKFELKAYTDSEHQKLAFEGTNENVVLKSSSTNEDSNNTVSVVVNPVKTAGNGKLLIKANEIRINSTSYGPINSMDLILKTSSTAVGSEYENISGDNYSVNGDAGLAAGVWYVTIRLNLGENQTVTSTLVATVYSNLTTTIDGKIDAVVSTTN